MKKSIGKSLLLCTLLLATLVPMSAHADDVDSKINEQTEKISAIKEQKETTESQIASLESDIATIYNNGMKLQKEQTALEEATATLIKEISDLQTRIEKRTEMMKNQARDIQVNGQDTSFVDAVLSADSVSDAVSRVQAVNTFVQANNELIQAQKADKVAVEQKKAENEKKAKRLAAAKEELDAQRQELVLKQAALSVKKISLAAEQATAESTRNSLLEQKAQAEAEQARIEKAQAEAVAKAKAEAVAQTTSNTTTKASETQATASQATTSSSQETKAAETTSSSQEAKATESTTQATASSTTQTSSSTEQATTKKETSTSTSTSNTSTTSADATLNALNALRVANGLNPVSWDASLAAAASSRAALINGNGGAIPSDHWTSGNEVIAILFSPGSDVINAWYNETNMITATGSGHRDWEMNPSITRVGFGYSGSVIVGHSA